MQACQHATTGRSTEADAHTNCMPELINQMTFFMPALVP